MFSEVIALGVTQPPVDNGRGLLPWLISSLIYFSLFMVCPSNTLHLLECGLWGYYSWFDKLPIGSGRGLSAIGYFSYKFSQGAAACFWVFAQTKVSVAVSWPLSLFRFCIYPLWCLNLGFCLIFSVSIFITSQVIFINFNLFFD